MNKRPLIAALALAGLLLFASALGGWWQRQDQDAALTLYGNVDIRELHLAFRQSGRLETMALDEGDTAAAGQVVAELDARPYRERLAAADAQVQVAQAELAKLQAGSRPQEIAQAQQEVHRAQAAYVNAERHFQRQHELLEQDSSSQGSVDAARAARDEAAARLAAARQVLSLQIEGPRREDIAAAQARLAAAQAAHEQAATALSDTRLVAPADATVLSRVLEPGSMVASGAPVYSLSLRDPLYVRAYVPEPALGRIAPGTPVQVRTDSSAKVYHGQIGFISPTAEFTPKSVETAELRTDLVYRLRIVIAEADDGLRQGMPVTVTVPRPVEPR